MLIKIDARGIRMLEEKTKKEVRNQSRWYYVGSGDEVPVLVVAKGVALSEGQIWESSSGTEAGYAGFCREAHRRKKIGKLTLQQLVEPGSVDEDAQIYPLSYQIRYFAEHFGNIIRFNRKWSQ